MDIKVKYQKKNKKVKDEGINDYASLVAKIRKTYPQLPEEINIKYYGDGHVDQASLDNEEEYKIFRKKIKNKVNFLVNHTNQQIAEDRFAGRRIDIKHRIEKENEEPQLKEEDMDDLDRLMLEHHPPIPRKFVNFKCKICEKEYEEECTKKGKQKAADNKVRYRCIECFNYDVCEECFCKEQHLKHKDHKGKNAGHEFVYLDAEQSWKEMDFGKLIRLFLDPYYGTAKTKETPCPPITHNDFIEQTEPFRKQMNYWQQQYNRILQKNIELWKSQYHNLPSNRKEINQEMANGQSRLK